MREVSDNVLDVLADAVSLPATPQAAVVAERKSDAPLEQAPIGQGITLLSGDARDVLPTLAANSVHCVVTSPPYYGLRDYGCAGQLGLEATPDEYLRTMVAVFREVRRVLRPDGTLWLNVGDSYAVQGGKRRDEAESAKNAERAERLGYDVGGWSGRTEHIQRSVNTAVGGLKPKDLLLMPARLALALQADGWWVRSDIIWAKPNPMPESVTDRPTSAHEHVFLLTKRARYFYDTEAVREPHTRLWDETNGGNLKVGGVRPVGEGEAHAHGGGYPLPNPAGRNLRNVWTLPTAPYSEAHFATFPPALAERCIRAGTSERGCCSACGAPWRRETQTSGGILGKSWHDHSADAQKGNAVPVALSRAGAEPYQRTTTGWSASCACAAPTQPCTVLDPFAGAGTTLLVADRLQRNAIGIELNADYTRMAMERVRSDAPLLFSSWPPAEDPADARMAYDARQRDMFAEAAN